MEIETLVQQIKHNSDRSANYERLYNALVPSYKLWAVRYYEFCSLDSIITYSMVSLTDAVRRYDPNGKRSFVEIAERSFVYNMDCKIKENNRQWRREMRVRRLIERYEQLSGYKHTGLQFFEENWCSSVEYVALEREHLSGSIGRILNEIELAVPEEQETVTEEWAEYLAKRKAFFEKYGF